MLKISVKRNTKKDINDINVSSEKITNIKDIINPISDIVGSII